MDDVQKILNSLGVEYSHYNEELLRPSTVEAKVTENAIKVRYPTTCILVFHANTYSQNHQRRKVEAARAAPSKQRQVKPKGPVKPWPPVVCLCLAFYGQ
jgi:hypothetical protein